MEIIDIVKKQAAERAFKQGKREGREEGREEAMHEFSFFIRSMKDRGLTITEIADLTKLSSVDIEKLLRT